MELKGVIEHAKKFFEISRYDTMFAKKIVNGIKQHYLKAIRNIFLFYERLRLRLSSDVIHGVFMQH